MPIYEYECGKCSLRFEVKRGFNEEGGNCCPRCGGEGRQIFSPAPLIFKGSGFYITDSRKNDGHSSDGSQPAKAESDKSAKKADAEKPKVKHASDNPPPKSESGKPC